MGHQENNSKGLTRVGGVVLAAGVILTVGFGWIVFFRYADDAFVPGVSEQLYAPSLMLAPFLIIFF